MNRKKRIISLMMGIILTFSVPTLALAQSSSNTKEEVVYVLLNNEGKINSVYVVNSFENPTGELVDYGMYNALRNLSTEDVLKYENGAVTGATSEEKFYYEGKMSDAEIPWNIVIEYSIDGKKVTAKELAGKSGELQITIKILENKNADATFYEHYVLQTSMQFDTNTCENIVAEGATITNVGENKNVSYTLLPKKEGTYCITTKVNNFEMGAISMNGVPFEMNIELDETSDMTSGITELSDGIAKLEEASIELQTGAKDLEAGVNTLNSKSESLVNGSEDILNAIYQLNKAVASIGEITDETGAISQLKDASTQYLVQIKELAAQCEDLPQSSQAILKGIENSSNGLSAIATDDQAMTTLLSNLSVMNDPSVNALIKAYQTKMSAVSSVATGLLTLQNQYTQFDSAISNIALATKALSDGYEQIDTGLENLKNGLSGLSELSVAVSTLSSQYKLFDNGIIEYADGYEQIASGYSKVYKGITDLSSGITKLSDNTKDLDKEIDSKVDTALSEFQGGDFTPVSFTSTENTNVSSVQFVMKTQTIEAAQPVIQSEEQPKEQSFWEKLLKLFLPLSF